MSTLKIPQFLGISANKKPLTLHKDAIGQGFAILGKRGKGKSVLAADMMEIFASRKQSFVVLDPPDAHWGIRYRVNGKGKPTGSSGVEILLVGGKNGDIPLDPHGGKDLANIIVEGNISCVISMKEMGFTERQRFCADFGEELFRINETPRHIFFEETQNFTPQVLKFEEQKRVLYAMEKIVEEGRGSGLGFTLISQRPALVNKNVLEQVDNMFALGVIGPNDLEQLKNWFKHHVRDKEKLNALVDDLATMKRSECWFLSPEWLDTMVRFNVRMRVTYHAGRTPEVGERPVNVKRFSVGEAVKKLRALFAAKTAQRAIEVKDLGEAKKEIKRLQSQISKTLGEHAAIVVAKTVTPIQSKAKVSKADIQAAVKEESKRFTPYIKAVEKVRKVIDQSIEMLLTDLQDTEKDMRDLRERMKSEWPAAIAGIDIDAVQKVLVGITSKSDGLRLEKQKQNAMSFPKQQTKIGVVDRPDMPGVKTLGLVRDGELKLGAGPRRMLAVLVQWSPNGMPEGQWRSHVGLRSSGTFRTYKSILQSQGFAKRDNDLWYATREGIDHLGGQVDAAPTTTDEVLAVWRPKLGKGPMHILDTLMTAPLQGLDKDALLEATGFASSGTFRTYLSQLKTARLIESQGRIIKINAETLLL